MEKHLKKEEFRKRIYNYIIRLVKFLSALPISPVAQEITKQLMRSGTSIGANYFEAQSASSKRDYQNYFNHSLKSANESIFWMNLLHDSNLMPKSLASEHQWPLQETTELAKIFASSILTMKKAKYFS